MMNQIKKMKDMETTQEVLDRTTFIQEILNGESLKSLIGLESNYDSYEKLLTIAFKIAIKKAHTVEEIEKCAVAVEECSCGRFDPDEWAEEIRIKAYGIEWYLKRQFSSSMFQEFIDFTTKESIPNPLNELEQMVIKGENHVS